MMALYNRDGFVKIIIIALAISIAFLGIFVPVGADDTCVIPVDDLIITETTFLCPGTYSIPDSGDMGVIQIDGQDIILYCEGAVLKGDDYGIGIVVKSGSANIGINECALEDYSIGIKSSESDNLSINDNLFKNNENYGIDISGNDLDIRDNKFIANNIGINVNGVSNSLFLRNFVKNNYRGIRSWNSNNNVFRLNEIKENFGGMLLHESDYNTLDRNQIYYNTFGVEFLSNSKSNGLNQNIIVNNALDIENQYFDTSIGNYGQGNKCIKSVNWIDSATNVAGCDLGNFAGSPVRLESNQVSAHAGRSVSHGDVDGDGDSDIIVGAPDYSTPGKYRDGAVLVHAGGTYTGVNKQPSLLLKSEQANTGYGRAISAEGDINRDYINDIVVGASNYGVGGKVYLYLGTLGMDNIPGYDLSRISIFDWSYEAEQTDERFGQSVTLAGDVNGDGYSDLIVGSPNYDHSFSGAGKIYLFLGGPQGFSSTPAWSAYGLVANYQLGNIVSAGDVNGDGFDDIIAAADKKIHVYFGSSTGPKLTTPNYILNGPTTDTSFAYSVSYAGDVNGDGYGEIVAGTFGGQAIYIFMGTSYGSQVYPEIIQPQYDLVPSLFGKSVSYAGDVNGDGFDDVVVGMSDGAYVYLGGSGGINPSLFIRLGKFSVKEGAPSGESYVRGDYGFIVSSAGDVDQNGFDEIIVGAPSYSDGHEEEGAAFVHIIDDELGAFAGEFFYRRMMVANREVTFDASNSRGLAPLTYTWDFGDGTIAETDSTSVTHTYLEPGTYSITLTVTSAAGFSDTRITTDDVIPVNTGGVIYADWMTFDKYVTHIQLDFEYLLDTVSAIAEPAKFKVFIDAYQVGSITKNSPTSDWEFFSEQNIPLPENKKIDNTEHFISIWQEVPVTANFEIRNLEVTESTPPASTSSRVALPLYGKDYPGERNIKVLIVPVVPMGTDPVPEWSDANYMKIRFFDSTLQTSLNSYIQQMSEGKVKVSGNMAPIVYIESLDKIKSKVGPMDRNFFQQFEVTNYMKIAAINQLDLQGFDFSPYDGDNNGEVDVVAFAFSSEVLNSIDPELRNVGGRGDRQSKMFVSDNSMAVTNNFYLSYDTHIEEYFDELSDFEMGEIVGETIGEIVGETIGEIIIRGDDSGVLVELLGDISGTAGGIIGGIIDGLIPIPSPSEILDVDMDRLIALAYNNEASTIVHEFMHVAPINSFGLTQSQTNEENIYFAPDLYDFNYDDSPSPDTKYNGFGVYDIMSGSPDEPFKMPGYLSAPLRINYDFIQYETAEFSPGFYHTYSINPAESPPVLQAHPRSKAIVIPVDNNDLNYPHKEYVIEWRSKKPFSDTNYFNFDSDVLTNFDGNIPEGLIIYELNNNKGDIKYNLANVRTIYTHYFKLNIAESIDAISNMWYASSGVYHYGDNLGSWSNLAFNPRQRETIVLEPEGITIEIIPHSESQVDLAIRYPDNLPPIAIVEFAQFIKTTSEITLDASKSYDVDGDTLTYYWDFNMLEDSDGDGDSENDWEITSDPIISVNLDKFGTLTTLDEYWGTRGSAIKLIVSDGVHNSITYTYLELIEAPCEIQIDIPDIYKERTTDNSATLLLPIDSESKYNFPIFLINPNFPIGDSRRQTETGGCNLYVDHNGNVDTDGNGFIKDDLVPWYGINEYILAYGEVPSIIRNGYEQTTLFVVKDIRTDLASSYLLDYTFYSIPPVIALNGFTAFDYAPPIQCERITPCQFSGTIIDGVDDPIANHAYSWIASGTNMYGEHENAHTEFTFTEVGDYEIQLTVTDPWGAYSTMTRTVKVLNRCGNLSGSMCGSENVCINGHFEDSIEGSCCVPDNNIPEPAWCCDSTPEAFSDEDGDGLSALEETQYGSNVCDPDTDDDSWFDNEEYLCGSKSNCGSDGLICIGEACHYEYGCTPQDASLNYDSDAICNQLDNCPDIDNADQSDIDFDSIGDACELLGCANVANVLLGEINGLPNINNDVTPYTSSDNTDNDSYLDACDWDIDGDGIMNVEDCAPFSIDNNCDNVISDSSASTTVRSDQSSSLTTPDNRITLQFEEDTFASSFTEVSITGTEAEYEGKYSFSNSNIVWSLNADAYLNKPVTLIVNYDQENMPECGVEEWALSILHYANGRWRNLNSIKDCTENTLTVELEHFSLYSAGIVDEIPPELIASSNIIIPKNSAETISWALYDTFPRTFELYRDLALVNSGQYTDGQLITQLVDTSTEGTFTYWLVATDVEENNNRAKITVTIIATTGPTITAPLDLTLEVGALESIDWVINDNDSGVYEVHKGTDLINSGAYIYPPIQHIVIQPVDTSAVGTTTYKLTATDTQGNSATDEVVVTVTAPSNQPPVLNSIGTQVINESETLTIFVHATDPEGENIVYSADAIIGVFYSTTGIFNWETNVGDSGNYTITFSASDGETITQETVTIIVNYVAPQIISVSSCQSLDIPRATYTVATNVASAGTCFDITADHVTLDCQGFTITGDYTGYGIKAEGRDNVELQNCNIETFNTGILLSGTSNSLVENNIVENSNTNINLVSSSGNNLRNNIVRNLAGVGGGIIVQTNSANNVIEYNTIEETSQGIYLNYANNNQVRNNNLTNNMEGLRIDQAQTNIVDNNYICSNVWDILAVDQQSNTGSGNTCDVASGWADIGFSGCTESCTIVQPQTDTTPPLITAPVNQMVEQNTTSSVNWLITEVDPNTYSIFRDGVLINSGTYTDGETIIRTVDTYVIGTFVYRLEAIDLSGNIGFDEVLVTITAPPAPLLPITVDVSSCQTLNQMGATYDLISDVGNDVGSCFVFTASDITLDCHNYNIIKSGTSSTPAIYISGQDGATVQNCNIQNYSAGITVSSSNNARVQNNQVSGGTTQGISLMNSLYSVVEGNMVTNSGKGIWLYGSSYGDVTNNVANQNIYGLYIDNSPSTLVQYNSANNNSNEGIRIKNSDSCVVDGNGAQSNVNWDMYVYNSPNTVLTNNIYEALYN